MHARHLLIASLVTALFVVPGAGAGTTNECEPLSLPVECLTITASASGAGLGMYNMDASASGTSLVSATGVVELRGTFGTYPDQARCTWNLPLGVGSCTAAISHLFAASSGSTCVSVSATMDALFHVSASESATCI